MYNIKSHLIIVPHFFFTVVKFFKLSFGFHFVFQLFDIYIHVLHE